MVSEATSKTIMAGNAASERLEQGKKILVKHIQKYSNTNNSGQHGSTQVFYLEQGAASAMIPPAFDQKPWCPM